MGESGWKTFVWECLRVEKKIDMLSPVKLKRELCEQWGMDSTLQIPRGI